ncbi:hypothetical protein FQB35_10395 [Crassaminicella thermophila]|uniref:Bro-N domain-containing protein n=1 Tax=Crassaminicella thermophila TaxID=2599308 RepID=A0A5C0SHM4_CRATE|nr:Bro-N domain-containing protein [Crassaminicella thermophila]QEK12708.1 hypothetical protein FQB35_10395 [Crassaminicella thermophila]
MNELKVFTNEQFGKVRTLMINNEPYFVGNDIAKILDYKEPHKAIVRHVDEEDRTKHPIPTNGGIQETWIINESGLYSLILSSKLPTAKKFKRWVTSEVLPSIRKEGAYITNNANPEMLRDKADEIESLTTLNETAKIMLPVLDKAGLKPQYQALALKQIYRKAGIDLPIEELKADKEIFDLESIAKVVGIYSKTNKPHGQAIKAILENIEIGDNEKKKQFLFEKNGHMGTTTQYTKKLLLIKVKTMVIG